MRQTLLVFAVLSLAGPASGSSGADSDSATRGLYVALRVCAACHAVGSLGVGPDSEAPSFATIRLRHDRASLRRRLGEISASGHQDMPPIPLTPQEIDDVANYIESVVPAAAPLRPSRSVLAAWRRSEPKTLGR